MHGYKFWEQLKTDGIIGEMTLEFYNEIENVYKKESRKAKIDKLLNQKDSKK